MRNNLGKYHMPKIAVIEDNPTLSEKYCEVLKKAGYVIKAFMTRAEAEQGVVGEAFDAWVLDIKLGQDTNAGIGLIGLAKDNHLKMPILVVSGLDPSFYRPITLELGVWDFVNKPVEDETLILKLKQLLDASNDPVQPSMGAVDNLIFDDRHPGLITWKGTKINISLTAWKFLVELTKAPNTVVTYDKLYKLVKSGSNKQNLRQHISNLRSSIGEYDQEFDHIKTVAGTGYIWQQ